MKKLLNNAVAVIVVMIVLLLIIPLNPFVLDVFIILNISISLIILLISMNIKEPLEFSIFPSMLLITTLFRIGINISSTRNILGNSGTAGAVIKAMGDFVLQGNVVVGFIIFIIIVLVQFLVITKGAERVAEVAARFTLDAMPGKQMAIDADLSTGLIDEQQAKERRYKIQKEADFYGAMDGATKIVKGDAVMSLIITAVNFFGGMIIGMVQGGMSFSEVLSVYSIATVGDGLVSQIPALLISTATGMVVTRSVSEGSLNEDASKQFLAQPKAIMITGAALAVMLVIPGMPKIQFGVVSLGLMLGGYMLTKRMEEAASASRKAEEMEEAMSQQQQMVSEEEAFKDISNVYDLIQVEPIEMEFGYSLIPLVDEGSGGKMINRIVIFRRQYAQEMGFVIPSIRLRDSSSLNTNQYVIKIRGEEVAKGEILVDYYLALEPPNPEKEIEGIDTIEPAYGIPSKWITVDKKGDGGDLRIYGDRSVIRDADPFIGDDQTTFLRASEPTGSCEAGGQYEEEITGTDRRTDSDNDFLWKFPKNIDESFERGHSDQRYGDDHGDDHRRVYGGERSGFCDRTYPYGAEAYDHEKVL